MNRLLALLPLLMLMLPGITLVACQDREEKATPVPTSTLTSTPKATPAPSTTATLGATPTPGTSATPALTSTPGETPQFTPAPTGESLTADEVIARAYQAMTQTTFAADVPPEPPVPQLGQPPYSIKYGPPDLLLMTGGGYEWPSYLFLVGKEIYESQFSGRRWVLLGVGSLTWQFERLRHDPRELLRIATDVRDDGTQELDGEPQRLVTVRRDATKFADEYLTGVELRLTVELPSGCPECAPPCFECARPFDRQRAEALGYRSPDDRGGLLLKGHDVQVVVRSSPPPSGDQLYITVQGVRELSPDLKEEFRQVLAAYGADPALLDTAGVHVSPDQDQRDASALELAASAQTQVTFWINAETFLVSKIQIGPATDRTDELAFIDYGKVELPEAEPSIVDREWEFYFDEVQRRWSSLAQALEAYAGSHGGLYPDEVSPAVLGGALASQGLEWPMNAITSEPMKETTAQNPGDFHYRVAPDRHCYFAEVYDWEGAPIAEWACGAAECPIMCPEAEALP
jgi:hypothetical protein